MLHFASQRDADAHVVHEQIAELQSKAQLDSNQEATLATLQQQLISLHSPVHSISDDILVYIFEVGSTDDEECSFAWTVSQVISRWRRVALATPQMWTNLLVKLPCRNTENQERWMAALDRSRACPLNVTIRLYDTSFNHVAHLPEQLALQARTYHLGRTLHLDYGVALPTFTDTLTTLKLESLALGPDWLEEIMTCLSSCHALRSLSIRDLYEVYTAEDNGPTIRVPDPRYLVKLPALETLQLDGHIAYVISMHLQAQPLVAKLELFALNISELFSTLLPHVLDKLSNVQSLELAESFWTSPTMIQILRATHKLRTLTLRNASRLHQMGDNQVASLPHLNRIVIICDFIYKLEVLKSFIDGLETKAIQSSLTVEIRDHYPDRLAELVSWLKERVHAVVLSSP